MPPIIGISMRIHKEGYSTLGLSLIICTCMVTLSWWLITLLWVRVAITLIALLTFTFILRFFRSPNREIVLENMAIVAPADGLVVAVQEEEETDFFKDKRIRISIFMSGSDVHVNWVPVSGEVCYFKYSSGKHLFARNPKSSLHNERTHIGIETNDGKQLLLRQVAGVMARRVVAYVEPGQSIVQGDEMGFIKLGSRIDLFLPLDSKILVSPGQRVIGRQTVLGQWSESC